MSKCLSRVSASGAGVIETHSRPPASSTTSRSRGTIWIRGVRTWTRYWAGCARSATKYYANLDDAQFVYDAALSWFVYDQAFKSGSFKELLCTSSVDQYFRFRADDAGVNLWMATSYPIYDDTQLAENVRNGLASRLAVRGCVTVNDLYSYDKERASGEPGNCFYLAPIEDTARFREFFDARIDDIIEDLNHLKTVDTTTRDVTFDLIYGNFLWSRASEPFRVTMDDVG
jgi:cyclooctat-9-en-7-ol synthase